MDEIFSEFSPEDLGYQSYWWPSVYLFIECYLVSTKTEKDNIDTLIEFPNIIGRSFGISQ
jgi:hypothetical protein